MSTMRKAILSLVKWFVVCLLLGVLLAKAKVVLDVFLRK